MIITKHRSRLARLQAIRRYPARNAERLIARFEHVYHSNILSSREYYLDTSFIYALIEDFPLSLQHLIASTIFPSELELGAILAQVCIGSRAYI